MGNDTDERDRLRDQVAYLRSILEAIAIMARQPEVRGQFTKHGADKFWDRLLEKLIEPALRGEA